MILTDCSKEYRREILTLAFGSSAPNAALISTDRIIEARISYRTSPADRIPLRFDGLVSCKDFRIVLSAFALFHPCGRVKRSAHVAQPLQGVSDGTTRMTREEWLDGEDTPGVQLKGKAGTLTTNIPAFGVSLGSRGHSATWAPGLAPLGTA